MSRSCLQPCRFGKLELDELYAEESRILSLVDFQIWSEDTIAEHVAVATAAVQFLIPTRMVRAWQMIIEGLLSMTWSVDLSKEIRDQKFLAIVILHAALWVLTQRSVVDCQLLRVAKNALNVQPDPDLIRRLSRELIHVLGKH